MTRSEELIKFLDQLRLTDLVDFLIVWAIIYGLLKLVRGTRAVQMAAGCSSRLLDHVVILGSGRCSYCATRAYFGFAYWSFSSDIVGLDASRLEPAKPAGFGRGKLGQRCPTTSAAAMTCLAKDRRACIIERTSSQNYIETV